MEETDRLTIKDAAPFALVIIVTLAVIGFIITASSAHADGTTQAASSGDVEIVQEFTYVNGSATLFPAVHSSDSVLTKAEGVSDGVYSWDPNAVKNAVDYGFSVKNIGDRDAYFRSVVALEESSGGVNALALLNADIDKFAWSEVGNFVDENGVNYVMYTAVYEDILKPEASVTVVNQIAMNKDAANLDVVTLGEDYNIMVATQAVQIASGSPVDDLNSAFGEITANSHPWSSGT